MTSIQIYFASFDVLTTDFNLCYIIWNSQNVPSIVRAAITWYKQMLFSTKNPLNYSHINATWILSGKGLKYHVISWLGLIIDQHFWEQSILKTGTNMDPDISWFNSRNKIHNDVPSWWDDCHEQGSIIWFACLPLIGSWIISLLLASALKGHHGILSPHALNCKTWTNLFSENPECRINEEEKHGNGRQDWMEWDVISRAPFAPVSEAYLWRRSRPGRDSIQPCSSTYLLS